MDLPHDWAIEGPFLVRGAHGGMGRLPSWGIGWYRRKLDIPATDKGRSIFLDVDGAMSYATVWLNGQIVGGWPFGYASWRIDLTPYLVPGGVNQLAIRLDNPPDSSRWYPGGGIYRNVWLTKTQPLHVGHWGTRVTTRDVSSSLATIELDITIDNDSHRAETVSVATRIYALDAEGLREGDAVATMEAAQADVDARSSAALQGSVTIANPRLWGPPPNQRPNRYVAVTTVSSRGRTLDTYQTRFGIRDPRRQHVSAYELYTAPFGSSADKVFASLERHPYVAGGFAWSGWDYLGEPTPYYGARSSYFGIVDLAGFKKDRFYLYQAQWRPDHPMAHILPHWTWPERKGQVTPVHVFTSGDEGELFLNGRSLGRKTKGPVPAALGRRGLRAWHARGRHL